MDGASAIKEAIKELPLQERAVAVALKFIFDQIKTLASKEQEEIQQEHAKCLESFKALERQVIIC